MGRRNATCHIEGSVSFKSEPFPIEISADSQKLCFLQLPTKNEQNQKGKNPACQKQSLGILHCGNPRNSTRLIHRGTGPNRKKPATKQAPRKRQTKARDLKLKDRQSKPENGTKPTPGKKNNNHPNRRMLQERTRSNPPGRGRSLSPFSSHGQTSQAGLGSSTEFEICQPLLNILKPRFIAENMGNHSH